MTLNAKVGGFMDFLAISGCDTSLYHSQGGATKNRYVQFGMTVIKLCFISNSCKSNSNSRQTVEIFLYHFVVLCAQ